MSRIEILTADQERELPAYRARWLSYGLCTDHADRPTAERAISAMYAEIGEAAPRYLWCDSPATYGMARVLLRDSLRASLRASLRDSLRDSLRASLGDSLGASLGDSLRDSLRASLRDSLGDSLWDSLRDSLWDSLWDSLGASLWASLWASLRASLRDSLRASLRASLWDSLGDSLGASLGASLGDSLRDSLRASLGDSLGDSLGASLGDSLRASLRASRWDSLGDSANQGAFYGHHEAYWIAHYNYASEALGVRYDARRARQLAMWADVARSCGWWYPFRGVVIATERPRSVSVEDDPRGDGRVRLHDERGPALLYRDGWAVHAIHGVRVPARVVESPESYTVAELRAIENIEVRRIAIERFGVRRYLDESGARTVDMDTFGGTPRALVRDADGEQWLIGTDGSTERVYHMSVPRDATSCRDAHGAIAGFDESRVVLES